MREPHKLEASKKTTVPRRMVFFDSEARTNPNISDEEVYRIEQGEKVIKEHEPYLLCATFYRDRSGEKGRDKKPKERSEDYHGPNFLNRFWADVDKFASTGQKLYVFAHNAKYDFLVTGAYTPLVVHFGYIVEGFSDDNPMIVKLTKHICPSCGKAMQKRVSTREGHSHTWVECSTCGEPADGDKVKRKNIIVLSSTNYFAQSLASLGKIFNLPKLDFDHGREIDPEDPVFMAEAITYARRDVEILRAAMLSFIAFVQRENLGNFSMTVAGQSFAAFRQRFLGSPIFIHSDERALAVERRAYAGGRNECFSYGKVDGDIFYCDINSMYPHVMREYLYPRKLLTFWESASVEQVRDAIQSDNLVCCDCLVNTDIPIFHKKQGKLIFPVGLFWTSLSTPEIIEGLNRGIIKEVKNVALYEPADIFSGYVDFFYNERLKARAAGDEVHQLLYKLMMNSLYGKFGQKNDKWERVGDAPPEQIEVDTVYDPDTRETKYVKIFGGGIFERNTDADDQEAFNSFPAIAAHVTSAARMLLFKFIELAGFSEVHYCDTDSVFVSKKGYESLVNAGMIDGKRLGALKLEDEDNDLILHGPKDYVFAGHVKMKGVSKHAKPLPPTEDGKLRFAVTQWGGFSDRLRDKDFDKYYNKVIIKTLKREYTKGTIEGNRILPFRLNDLEEEREAARREIAAAQKQQAATAEAIDPIASLIKIHGYIKRPKEGERFFGEVKALPFSVRCKYFRTDKGSRLDEWADASGYQVNELLDIFRK